MENIEQSLIKRACELSVMSVKKGCGPFGCAITDMSYNIVAEGNNRVTELNDPTAHAEIIAIRDACQKMHRVEQMKKIQSEALELFTKKNIDYGDAFAKYGVIGVLMRIEDKLQRSMSITKNGVNLVNDEGIRDTLIDLHNYAAMALMLLDE